MKYLGQVIDEKGRTPDPSRTDAIKYMSAPTNVAALQSFLVMANYYNIYIPYMHKVRAPLNHLLKKDVKWNWTDECKKAFEKLKTALTSNLALIHYNPNKQIYVASYSGLRVVILHKEDGKLKLIQDASRTLLTEEINYLQIEKEGLAIILAIKKFHKYVHSREFILQTDHHPLLEIFGSKKGIPSHTANRLQRRSTMLLNNSFKMEFSQSKEIAHMAGLSRLIPKNTEPLEETVIASLKSELDVKYVLFNTVKELLVTQEEIEFKTKFDKFIIQTKKELTNPKVKTNNIFSTCLMYGERVVIPAVLAKKTLKDVHTGHPGMSRMKALMRSYVHWPGMDRDIENMVKSCKSCALIARAPPIKI